MIIEDTAEIFDGTRTSGVDDLALAKALENVPLLAHRRANNDIKRTVRELQGMFDSVKVLSALDKKMKDITDQCKMYPRDP